MTNTAASKQLAGEATPQVQDMPPLIRRMLEPDFYPHAVDTPIRLLQTHAAYVLLTGEYAYKVKKPVNLGFLDFSTLELRHHYCLTELDLNRRYAPKLYLDVLPITRTASGHEQLGGTHDPVVEYTVKMRQFPQDNLFSNLFAAGKLEYSHMEDLGHAIAEMHRVAPTSARIRAFGSVAAVKCVADDNYAASLPHVGGVQTAEQLARTRAFSDNFFTHHADWFERRQAEDKIRDCHGDLHLRNVCLYEGRPQPFDCIEFNESFRYIDVLYDVAFMVMDLGSRDRWDLAMTFLNAYLEHAGDYWGAVLLPLYLSMRASVRAKTSSFLLNDPAITAAAREQARLAASAYYRLAADCTRPQRGRILAMSGLSGSGKSTLARYLARLTGGIHIRSDAVRKQLAGVPLTQRGSDMLYTSAMTERTYDRLLELGIFLARHGQTVVLDAKYDRRAFRRAVIAEATASNLPLMFFNCEAPLEVMRERLRERAPDVSDATSELVARQAQTAEPFAADEQPYLTNVDTLGDWEAHLRRTVKGIGASLDGRIC